MKKTIVLLALISIFGFLYAEEDDMYTMSDDISYYASLTNTADYAVKPLFAPMPYSKHNLIDDIKVTAIESIPFGFLYTFAGLWVAKAIQNHTWNPNVGTLKENQQTYIIAIGAFMSVNVAINILTFYDYKSKEKPVK